MRISAVVPSFNQAAFIGLTLESLLGQGDPDLEIIVVDGGSTDGSVDIIRRYADRLAWWVSESDRGQSHALNKGFARASGEWLCWLNSDDMLLPGALRTVRTSIEQDPKREWWIGGGDFVDQRGRFVRSHVPPIGLSSADQLGDWRHFWFAQPSTFFSRPLFQASGGVLREDLHYAMDLDLWIRFIKRAAPGFIESKLSAYRIHEAAKTGALTVPAEMEIVRLLMDSLGMDAVMSRVECIAADRLDFEQKYRRLQAYARPFIGAYSRLKSATRFLSPRGGKSRAGR
jgi:glycosyltransferase involved in cell wall biosynthesis